MKTNELGLVYFSPTGTTRKVIMEVARNIDMKSVSFDLTIHKEKKPNMQFGSNDFVLFGIPVYGGRVPKTFLEYFDTLKGSNTPAALIATYGCREYEDALLELKNEVESRGFKVIGAGAFPVQHSIIRQIGLGRPNKADMKVIADFGIQLNRKLRNSDNFDAADVRIPGNSPYKKYSTIPLVPKADINLCTECKTCAKACPAGAISMEDPKKTDKKKCISCMKCVYSCKKKARYVNSMKLNMASKKLIKVCKNDKEAEIFI